MHAPRMPSMLSIRSISRPICRPRRRTVTWRRRSPTRSPRAWPSSFATKPARAVESLKIDARRVAAFLRDPGSCRVVLLFGEDTGLIRERADALVRAVAGALDDPFRVAELAREDIGTLPAEAASLSLTGGRRVVRVREAGEAALAPVQAVLAGPGPALVVLEGAAGLPARSRLRAALEAAADGAAIG